MANDKDTEIRSRYDDYTVEELKEAYQTIFLYSSEYSDADLAEMDEILAVLKKKNPVPRKYTTEESWALFQETYSEELSRLGVPGTEEVMQVNPPADADKVQTIPNVKTPRPVRYRKLLRTAMVAAVIVVILVAAAATVYAMGYDIFGWVPKWNDDVLSFGEDESPAPNDLHDTYKIPAALKQLGIDEPLYPTWLPEGFKLSVSIVETKPVLLHEGYNNGDRYLSITVEPISHLDAGVYEKDGTTPFEYYAHNRMHYIVSDNDQYTATWECEKLKVLVIGNVSLEEMKRIIDSVYEEN